MHLADLADSRVVRFCYPLYHFRLQDFMYAQPSQSVVNKSEFPTSLTSCVILVTVYVVCLRFQHVFLFIYSAYFTRVWQCSQYKSNVVSNVKAAKEGTREAERVLRHCLTLLDKVYHDYL